MANFSTAGAVKVSFNNLIPGWRAAWGALVLYAVTASALAVTSTLIASPPSWSAWTAPISGLVVALATVPAWGALLRLGLRDRHPRDEAYRIGPAGMQWRAGEWRILASILLLLLTLLGPFGLIIAAYVPLSSSGVVSIKVDLPTPNAAPAPHADLVQPLWALGAAAVPLAFLCALAVIAVRLVGQLPASVERQRIVWFGAWPLTRGGLWPILLACLVVAGANLALSLVGDLLFAGLDAFRSSSHSPTVAETAVAGLVKGLCRIAMLPAIARLLYVYRTATPDPRLEEVFD